jgi:CheY-like chemotaxis protein
LAARAEGPDVVVEVSDDGIGMSAEVQSHLFEPYFTTKGERGTGLGLASVYGIVRQHQGTLFVRSVPSNGSTFVLRLPAWTEASPDLPVAAPAPGATSAARQRVLAVEDEAPLRALMTAMLSVDGHEVTAASSAKEALALLDSAQFDVLVSDVGLGQGMNGWQLTAEVRERFPEMRIVLCTGWGAQIEPEEARSKGVDAVVPKPYRLTQLRSALGGEMAS